MGTRGLSCESVTGRYANCVAWVAFTNVCSRLTLESEAIGARPELSIRVVSTSVS